MMLLPIVLLWGSAASNCQAAFVPPSSSKTAGPRIVTTAVPTTTTSLYLDNLPKSLSGMEINLPDNIKDTIANIPKPPLLSPPGTTATVGGTNKLTPTPPLPFDPTNPEALISITKAFIASDFGIQSSQLRDYSTAPKSKTDTEGDIASTTGLPFYSSSLLLSTNNFVWVSGNNLNDGRTGLLTKDEYLAAGRYFDLRKSFPDLEYRAHDFRVIYDEESSEYGSENREGVGTGEITVRFTTRTTGTFRGAPLKLRSMVLEPNGKVMKCPPTSISITYSTRGEDRGKIIKLVTDQVLDRQVCNTNGLSGIPAAAVIGGASTNAFLDVVGGSVPPLVALGRVFSRPLKPIVDNTPASGDGASNLAPFPDSVLIQLAKGVIASNFGLNDPNLLAETFMYLEPLMGPLDKDKYLQVFTNEYDVRSGVPDLDYGLQNFRVDPYDPYRVWVDSRPKGTRVGSIGMRALPQMGMGGPMAGAGQAMGAQKTEKIVIPTVCAGTVIGKQGSIIREINAQSGTKISVAAAEPTAPNDRVVSITGPASGIQAAIYLIRQRVESYQPPAGSTFMG